MSFLDTIKQDVNNYIDSVEIRKLESKVERVLREREELKSWTDRELRLSAAAFRDDLSNGKSLDSMAVAAFAVVNEAARRVLGQSPYPVQILAGFVIHKGRVAEMKAGEGKTLTETMPVYLNALEGRGVHVITTNDYLAERDAKWMGKLYGFLGLTVGHIAADMKNEARRKAYACDITYVSNQEVGFDYLRDNLVFVREDRVLRRDYPLHFGIVDEIDSILIDESRTPLIVAEAVKDRRTFYDTFTRLASQLEEDKDFIVDYKNKSISIIDKGLDKAESILGKPIFSKDNPYYVFYLDACLKARVIFEKDRDYIVSKSGIDIVDEFTGRVLPGRRFTDGIHQAIEAKEKVKVKDSDRTQASITFQNFFPMYQKLSGMSGTVLAAREEFNQVYKLDVVQIPTNKPMARVDHNDLFFKTQRGKFLGMMKKIPQVHGRGQPVLIGARTVESAHEISRLLNEASLPHQLLTASDNREEAEKIAKAGEQGMITVATNMAGRGTDILLGPGVDLLGGLYVIGTERHESRRIDDQLIGRAGRQGEPGESQFLISMEDEIMQVFGSEHIIDIMEEYDMPEDEYVSAPSLDRAFKTAQEFVESKNYDSRIYLYKYDRVLNFQRSEFYKLRDSLLENELIFAEFLQASIREVLDEIFAFGDPELVARSLEQVFSVPVNHAEISGLVRERKIDEARKKCLDYFSAAARNLKKQANIYEASQKLILQIMDEQWANHLELMEILKQEAGLFSYASVNPLIDFIRESRRLYEHLGSEIQWQFLKTVFMYMGKNGLLE